MNTVIYVATNNSLLSLYDTTGSLLDAYSIEPGSKIVSIAAPIQADDAFIAILTDTDNLYGLKL